MKNQLMSDKRGKMGPGVKVFLWVLSIIGAVVVIAFIFGGGEQAQVGTGGTTVDGVIIPATCPSDLGFSGTVDVQNALNKTGAETYDTTMRFYQIDPVTGAETFQASITDTSSGSATLTCGKTYVARVLSTSGVAGDSSVIRSATMSGAQSLGAVSGGGWKFFVTGDSGNLKFNMHQSGLPQVRAWDLNRKAYMSNVSDNSTSAYSVGDAVNFSSTNSNTPTTIASGGAFDVLIEYQSQVVDESPNDQGIYFLIDAATTIWDTPVVKLDGSILSDVTSSLNPDEKKAYSGYEYVYLIPADKTAVQPNKLSLEVFQSALSGQNPDGSNAQQHDFAPIGTYTSVSDSNLLKVGSVADDTSQTVVHRLWDINYFQA